MGELDSRGPDVDHVPLKEVIPGLVQADKEVDILVVYPLQLNKVNVDSINNSREGLKNKHILGDFP